MINKRLVKKYIKYYFKLLFITSLCSMQNNNNNNNNNNSNNNKIMDIVQHDGTLSRYLNKLIIDGMNDLFMRLIIQHGININYIDDFGQTPLMVACKQNNFHLVKFIIINGATIDVTDIDGKSALDYAQQNENSQIINLLIHNNKDSYDISYIIDRLGLIDLKRHEKSICRLKVKSKRKSDSYTLKHNPVSKDIKKKYK